jgi:hypothetical protein
MKASAHSRPLRDLKTAQMELPELSGWTAHVLQPALGNLVLILIQGFSGVGRGWTHSYSSIRDV